MRAISDGVQIAYDDSGRGESALLCMPGWCASRKAFDGLQGLLPRRRVMALDWRGHGGSEAAKADFGAEEQVRDALAVIEQSGVREVVPLATAHAGWVAIELRRRLGAERVPKIVLVDWIVGPAPPPFLAGLAAMQDASAWRGVRDQLFATWTTGVGDKRVIDFVKNDMGSYDGAMWGRAGREIAAAYGREGSPLEALAKLVPAAPTLHVFGAQPGALEPQRAFAEKHPWFVPVELDVRSHFPTIEAPERVAQEVERFLSAGG